MKALVFEDTLRYDPDFPVPAYEGEALIKVRLAGICNTDIELTRGYKGFAGVLGHEFVGEVVRAPRGGWTGKRVCGEINVRCHTCRWCHAGYTSHCENRSVLGILGRSGAFAEFLSLPLENLHPVPDAVDDDEAVYVEPLAAAFEVLEQVPVSKSDTVVILGDGKLGLLCAQVVAGAGASVTVIGKHVEKLTLARDWGVATRHISDGPLQNVDIVVEATGSAGGLQMALTMLRPRGTLVMKSTTAQPISVDLSIPVVKELNLIGSRCGPFQPAIEALRRRTVSVRPLTQARYPLSQGVHAMGHAATPGTLKVLLDIAR